MDLFLDPEAGKPLTAQLYEQLRRAITGGRLLPGDQLGAVSATDLPAARRTLGRILAS